MSSHFQKRTLCVFETAQRKPEKFSKILAAFETRPQLGATCYASSIGSSQVPLCEHDKFAPFLSARERSKTKRIPEMKKLIVLILLVGLANGCVTKDVMLLDTTKRTANTNVAVIYPDHTPMVSYKEIAKLSYLGPLEEEFKALRYMQIDAGKIGADAIIYEGNPSGYSKSMGIITKNGGGFGSSSAFVFKSTAIVFSEK